MTLDDYRRDITERDRRRAVYQALAAEFDACLTLAAPGAAPVGLGWTGDPAFVIPGLDARRSGDLAPGPSRMMAFRSGFSCSASPTPTRRCFQPPAACWLCCSRAERRLEDCSELSVRIRRVSSPLVGEDQGGLRRSRQRFQ